VDSSEFLVAAAATVGFVLGTGGMAASVPVVLPLLAGGLVAAPIAAWLVKRLPSRVLGVAAGGLIVVTNTHLLFGFLDVPAAGIWLTILVSGWVAAIVLVSLKHRRRLLPGDGRSGKPG
jgi:hypothetical protein